MSIPHALYLVVFGALIVAAVSGAWSLLRRIHTHKRGQRWARYERTTPPPAAVVGGGIGARAHIARWLPFALLFGGGSAALELHLHATDVWVVHMSGETIVVSRSDYFGDAAARYAPRAGDNPSDDDAWVINDSSFDAYVEYSTYGTAKLPDRYAERLTVPPGTSVAVDFIDDIGPDHPPPSSIDSQEHAMRGWLTWNPRDSR
jgi:hypothetical protein